MGFPSPEVAALDGYSPGAQARVVASSTAGEVAAVLVETPDLGGYLDFSMFHLYPDGWEAGIGQGGGSNEVSSSGYTERLCGPLDDDMGALAVWGRAPDGVTAVVVSIEATDWEVEVQRDGYWVFLANGVGLPDDLDTRITVRPAAARTEIRQRPADGLNGGRSTPV
jgi:hypothetical protein